MEVRASLEEFAGDHLTCFRAGSASVLGYLRGNPAAVFSAQPESVVELLTGETRDLHACLTLQPYEVLWLDCRA